MASNTLIILARMKLAVLRHKLHGKELSRFRQSILFGLTAVIATFWIVLQSYNTPGQASDVMAIVFAMWAIGWIIGPILFSGEDRTLLPEHFRSLPLTSQGLATGLLGASFVSVPALVSLLAFASVVAYAAPLGVVPIMVAVAAILLQVLLVILASRAAVSLLREYTQSHLAAFVGSLVTGALAAFLVTGWALFVTAENVLANGFSNTVSAVLHVLPTGWGVVAIDAASQGQWLLSIGALLGLGGLVALLRLVWARLLVRRLTTKRTQEHVLRASTSWRSSSAVGAVLRKEFLTWRRDYTRASFMYFALFYSLFVCLYPAANGAFYLLPFIGILFVISAVGSTANLYGADGSALWQLLVTPNAARSDIRGRQWAWLIVVAPIAVLASIVPVVLTGYYWVLPITLSLVVVGLGAGAGLLVMNSVYNLEPMTDPHKRGDDAFEHSISWWQFVSLLLALVILAAPTASFIAWGIFSENSWLQWMALPVAALTGVFYFWLLGRLSARRLEKRGPELLQTMLRSSVSEEVVEETKSKFDKVYDSLPWHTKAVMVLCMIVAPIALLPQGVMPLIFKLSGEQEKVWFLALYMPEQLQWPVIAAMFALGIVALALLLRIYKVYAANLK